MKSRHLFSIFAAAALTTTPVFATDEIIRSYQSVRSAGMGGVKLTTGLYDENFFGNPARAVANPRFRVTILDPMVEASSSAVTNIPAMTNGDDFYSGLADTAGDNNHARMQTTMPSVYFPAGDNKLAIAVGVITSSQLNVNMRRSYNLDPQGIIDIGPTVTVARRFLENDALALGLNLHGTYRLATSSSYTAVDLIKGRSLSPTSSGGQGAHIDVDLGGTFVLPVEPMGFQVTTGLALNNIMGGKYENLSMQPASGITALPIAQPRTLGFGAAVRKAEWASLTDTVIAMEFTDIGNNSGGSLFRTLHLGGETHFGILAPRLGLNQGYIAAGLGIDLRFVNIDVATYGEELSLNVGGQQDRRFAFKLAFQI